MKNLLIFALVTIFSSSLYASNTPHLRCFGTEPFWKITTDTKGFLSMTDIMTDTNKFYSKTVLKNAQGTSADFAFQIEARDQGNNTLKLNIVKTTCNDGMSDNSYLYTALVDVEGKILFGCCNQ